jgi:hypothetical protein
MQSACLSAGFPSLRQSRQLACEIFNFKDADAIGISLFSDRDDAVGASGAGEPPAAVYCK